MEGPIVLGATSETYQRLKNLKDRVLSEGILCYEDAYSLAYWYLRKYPQIKDVISERFEYVFIDEMQDTEKNNKVFWIGCLTVAKSLYKKLVTAIRQFLTLLQIWLG
ncbi:UvrD-helicase domain-containing protein [Brevibacillus laterosporus]|uniref:UvrD-helicase domain-containing protein n=1 Tax=Brevibacillus laterosporus TaxID=1465 RepID=UPI0034DEE814